MALGKGLTQLGEFSRKQDVEEDNLGNSFRGTSHLSLELDEARGQGALEGRFPISSLLLCYLNYLCEEEQQVFFEKTKI